MKMTATALLLALAGSPALAEYVKVSDDLTVYYETAGTGPQTILFVPGWTMSTEVFERQFEHFKDSTEYTFISFDPRSQGRTTDTIEGNYYEQHGRDVDAFMTALNLDNVVLGGWSNAGFTVLSYVHQFGSDKLAGLVMIDAAPSGRVDDNVKEWGWFRRDDADAFLEYWLQGSLLDRPKLNREFAQWMVSEEAATEEFIDWIDRIAGMTTNDAAAVLTASSFYQEYAADLTALEGKAQLLYVTNPGWKEVVEQWAAKNTPSAAVTVMDKHMSFWEKPEQLNDPLDTLLAKLK